MSVRWIDIAFEMPAELVEDARAEWTWLLPDPWTPVLCSKVGGMFVEIPNGEVLWLDCATGSVELAAASVTEFHDICRHKPDIVDVWFLPPLVERLHAAGKIAGPGECYGFTIFPVFAEGKYVPDNMHVASMREVLVGIAHIHKQLSDLPNGTKVQIEVVKNSD
jgi:hypothetical protein